MVAELLVRRALCAARQDWALVAEIDAYLLRIGAMPQETPAPVLERRGPGRPRKNP